MTDQEKIMSWLEGLSQNDWRQFHSDSEVSNIAKAALTLLKEQQKIINALESDLKETLEELADKEKAQEPITPAGVYYNRDWDCGYCGYENPHENIYCGCCGHLKKV